MKSLLKLTGLLIASLVLVGKVHAAASTGMNVIAGSAHDFTLTYLGANVAVNQCSTCHEMHKAKKIKPLWARNNPDATLTWKVRTSPGYLPENYTNTGYDNGTSTVTAGSMIPKAAFVDSRSGLCLSCHDGTQAITQDGGMIQGNGNITSGPGDLSKSHRIGNERMASSYRLSNGVQIWTNVTDASLKAGDTVMIDNGTGPKARYFVGCTTCHSMHSSPATNQKLLVNSRDGNNGPVCLDCHGGK